MPPEIATLLKSDRDLPALMQAIAEYFQCDRCFLYLRDPETRYGRVPFCWTRTDDVPVVYNEGWNLEPESLPDEDPMFAAALATKPSIFVEDVTTAGAEVLNAEFERENFGHRALIHGHLCWEHQLWGVLQPCLMQQPRHWTEQEKAIVNEIIQQLTPIVVQYVRECFKSPSSESAANQPI